MNGLAVKGFQWCPSVRMTTSSDPENKPSVSSSRRFVLATRSYEPPLTLSCSCNRANELSRSDSISSSSKTVARRLAAKSMLDVRYTSLQKGICSFRIEVMRYSWHRRGPYHCSRRWILIPLLDEAGALVNMDTFKVLLPVQYQQESSFCS